MKELIPPTEYAYRLWEWSTTKFLWYFWTQGWNEIVETLKNKNIFDKQIQEIFNHYHQYIMHYWEDNATERKKIYINLYSLSFRQWLKIISHIKKILWEEHKYFLEKNFLQFDCIWIDIYPNKSKKIKIYEILKRDNFMQEDLKFFNEEDIKEYWCLKDFFGRKKFFFRFKEPYIWLKIFLWDTEWKKIFELEKRFKISLKKKVKYYCFDENGTQEIYFI